MTATTDREFAATADLETARELTDDELLALGDALEALGATGASTTRRGTHLAVTATVAAPDADAATDRIVAAAARAVPGATVLDASAQTYDDLDADLDA